VNVANLAHVVAGNLRQAGFEPVELPAGREGIHSTAWIADGST